MELPTVPPTVDPPCSFHRKWSMKLRRHLFEPIIVFMISVSLWAVYRYVIINYTQDFGSFIFNLGQIIMQPLIWLGPALVYWFWIRKREGMFFTMTRDRAVQVTLVAVLAVSLYYVLFERLMYVLDFSAGTATTSPEYVNIWTEFGAADFGLMTFTFFFIVGPVEEMFNRGFLLGQFAKVLTPIRAVLLSAFFFAAGHYPINVIFYHFSPKVIFVMTFYYMGFGVFMGLFYLWSRNLLGAIVLHGFWDWVLSIYSYYYFSEGELFNAIVRLVIVEWILVAIFCFFFFQLYKKLWREEWQNSWGLMNEDAPRPALYLSRGWDGDPWEDRVVRAELMTYYGSHHSDGLRGRRYDAWGRRKGLPVATTGVFVVIALLCGATMAGSYGAIPMSEYFANAMGFDDSGGPSGEFGDQMSNKTDPPITQYGDENSEVPVTIDLPDGARMVSIEAVLEWEDEDDMRGGLRYHNEPDSLGLYAEWPDDTNGSAPPTEAGRSILSWKSGSDETHITNGSIDIVVVVGECGDQVPFIGLLQYNDDGNEFTLTVRYTYQPALD